MIPNTEQRRELGLIFAACRWAFNEANTKVNNRTCRAHFGELRSQIVPLGLRVARFSSVHNKYLARSVKHLVDAYKTNFAKMRKQGKTYKFKVQYRSYRRSPTETIVVERGSSGPCRGFNVKASTSSAKRRDSSRPECLVGLAGITGGIRLQDKQRIVDMMLAQGKELDEDAKIKWDKRSKSYHFILTYAVDVPVDPDPLCATKRLLSVDLGVNPPVQFYQPDGTHGRCLDGLSGKGGEIAMRLDEVDKLERRLAERRDRVKRDRCLPIEQKRGRDRSRRTALALQCREARQRRRLYGMVESAHYDVINLLLSRSDILIVPKLAVGRLSERAGRRLDKKTTRRMLALSHGYFMQRLKSRAEISSGRHVVDDTGEPGTSKTRGCCGRWSSNLGGNMVTRCQECNIRIDRQVNGARNNMLAALGKAMQVPWDGVHG